MRKIKKIISTPNKNEYFCVKIIYLYYEPQ